MDLDRKNGTSSLIESALVAAVFILPSLAVGPEANVSGGSLSAAKQLETLCVFIPQTLLLVYIIGLRGQTREFYLRAPRGRDALAALTLLPAIAAASWGGATLARLFLETAPAIAGGVSRPDLPLPFFLPLLVVSSLAVGYREELLYRAYFIRALELGNVPGWSAALLSAALFAAGHRYQGPDGAAGAALAGLVLGIAYLRTRSLHALAWAHAAYDVLAVLSTMIRPNI